MEETCRKLFRQVDLRDKDLNWGFIWLKCFVGWQVCTKWESFIEIWNLRIYLLILRGILSWLILDLVKYWLLKNSKVVFWLKLIVARQAMLHLRSLWWDRGQKQAMMDELVIYGAMEFFCVRCLVGQHLLIDKSTRNRHGLHRWIKMKMSINKARIRCLIRSK